MNQLGRLKVPFFFMIDFEGQDYEIQPLSEIDPAQLLYDIRGIHNVPAFPSDPLPKPIQLEKFPVSLTDYHRHFDLVMQNLQAGNTFLLNLTLPTPIQTNLSLKQIFLHSQARYRLWFQHRFVVFSPETFITIEDDQMSTYPMKGTLSSKVPNAEEVLLNDAKELAEHVTIVDLLRNDMSMVASEVQVSRFRYIDRVSRYNGEELLQVSSEIHGKVRPDWEQEMGTILAAMLPAGSICGAPKDKTLQIIHQAESYDRGYYTGVMGVFDGHRLDSGVMIRFIEEQNGQLLFKSGGGITARSVAEQEYQELIEKIYVPFN